MKKKLIAVLVLILSLNSVSVFAQGTEVSEILGKERVAGSFTVSVTDPLVESVYLDIIERVPSKIEEDRGYSQDEWYYSKPEVKWNVAFGELLLEKVGASEVLINNYYSIYKSLAEEKMSGEMVAIRDEYGIKSVVYKFMPTLIEHGIDRASDLRYLGVLLHDDKEMIEASGKRSLMERDPFPFNIGEYSRENLLLSATTLVGRVRYVWGGGHAGISQIEGINPLWKPIADSYGKNEGEPGYNSSIVPGRSWSPRFGNIARGDKNLESIDKKVWKAEGFVEMYEELMEIDEIKDDTVRVLKDSVDFSKGVRAQRFEGLDCSGFTSWAYNQIDSKKSYDGLAKGWVVKNGFSKLSYGSELLPGDIISWDTHIVMVVGEYVKGSGQYITLESAPNMVKFGIAYYKGTEEEIESIRGYVREVNRRLGGIPEIEKVEAHRLNGLRNSLTLGRSKKEFEVIGEDIRDWEAPRIIDLLSSRLPEYMKAE